MKLKIKVKNLIVLILFTFILIFIVVPLVNLEIATYLNNNDSPKAQMFFNNYMASPIRISEKRGLYEYGSSLIKGFEKFQINFSGWGGGEETSPENMEKAMELFQEILLKDKENSYMDDYSARAYVKLLDTSIVTLNRDKLIYWIDWGKDKENEEIRHISKSYQAYYYFVEKDYEKSKKILEGFTEEDLDGKYYQLMGDVNLRLGNRKAAEKNYEALVEYDLLEMNPYNRRYFGGSEISIYEEGVRIYLDKSKGQYRIKGKVSHNGRGLPFVEVYISKDIGTFSTGGKLADAVTDKNGEFETLALKQGVYDIGIGIHPSQLYDKAFLSKDIYSIEINRDMEFNFDFVQPIKILADQENMLIKDGEDVHVSWDRVEGADYYKLDTLVFTDPKKRSGGLFTTELKSKDGKDKIKNNKLDINLNSLDKTIGGLSFEGEEEIVNPTGIFGSFIPHVKYPLTVKAYDKKENLLATSLSLISDYEDLKSIEIDGDLTRGENLILDKKYEEAISYYEKKLDKDPKDKEALFYLVRFYSIGWKIGEKDIPKALRYAEIYDKEYKDYNLSLEVIEELYSKEVKKNKELVREVLERTPEEYKDTDYYGIEARYFLAAEDFLKARESYEKTSRKRSVNMVYIDIYLEDYEKAIETLNKGEIDLLKMNKAKLIEALKAMEDISQSDKNLFRSLLKTKLDGTRSLNEEKIIYKETLKLVKSIKLKRAINEIAKEEYWDQTMYIEDN